MVIGASACDIYKKGVGAAGLPLGARVFSAIAERTLSGMHDEALMRAFGAGVPPAAIDRGAEEVRARIGASRVDVVVLGEVAHGASQCART